MKEAVARHLIILITTLLPIAVAHSQDLREVSVRNRVGKPNGGVVITDADGKVVGYTDYGDVGKAWQCDVFRELMQCIDRAAAMSQRQGDAEQIMSERRALECGEAERRKPERRTASQRLPRLLNAPTHRHKSVGPLLKNLWSQYEAPYNWLSPKIDGQPCDAGCVALAMAQVMHYWQWPEHGYGSYTYTDKTGCGETLSVDYSQHYYDWENMLANYEGVQYTEAQGYAVAQLLYDCGVAVDMSFGVEASGARVVKQPLAMVRNFGYDSSCQMHYRDFYTLDEWTQMFYDELDAGRPILMSGLSKRYNHAFVCDGYDERGFFHFSFGNVNGAADGFFYLPYLTPDIPPEMLPDEPEGGFNILQSMTTRIMPSSHSDATGIESHLFAMSRIEALGGDTCVVHNLGNIGWNVHNDSVALALVHNDEIVAFPYVYQREFLLEEIDDTTYTDTICVTLPRLPRNDTASRHASGTVADGTYKLMPMFRDNGEWQQVLTSVGTPNYLIANVSAGDVSLHADTVGTARLTLESVDFPRWLKPSCTPDYSLRLKCHNADICARVYIIMENVVDSLPSVLLQCQGLTLADGEEAALRFHHTSHSIRKGTYNLRVYYNNDLFTGDIISFDNAQQTVVVDDNDPSAISDTHTECGLPEQDARVFFLNGTQPSGILPRNNVLVKNGRKIIN